MIQIAIVEDNNAHAEVLKNHLKSYEQEHSVFFQIYTFKDGADILSNYTAEYDIIFLDIQMKHIDGMKTAEKIRTVDENVSIIFVTSSMQYAIQGYQVDALGYIVKPVSYLAISQILKKAIKRIQKKQTADFLPIAIEGGQIRLFLNQIYYIESQRHNVSIHTEKGTFLTAGPLKKLEEELISKNFFKCHNAYLVNLHHVVRISQNTVILSENQELSLSRTCKKLFLAALADYLG